MKVWLGSTCFGLTRANYFLPQWVQSNSAKTQHNKSIGSLVLDLQLVLSRKRTEIPTFAMPRSRRRGIGAGGGAPPPPPKPKRSRTRKRKTLEKRKGVFLCTNEDCRNTWSSVHAWSPFRFDCQKCEGTAKELEEVEEECDLDRYECGDCGIAWQSIHYWKTTHQYCDCGKEVARDAGIQRRFGTHYYYQCKGDCAEEWEYFYDGEPYTQRCAKCYSRGKMMGVKKVVLGPDGQPMPMSGDGRRRGRGTYGEHDIGSCDMCHVLKSQGIANSCKKKRMVAFEEGWDPISGEWFDRIVDWQ